MYFLFSLVVLGLFVAAFAENDSPRKWAIPFFLFSWVVLVAIHEAGHAIMSWIVGWGVHEVVIGFGKPILKFRCYGVPVEICAFPISGHVLPIVKDFTAPRMKNALIYAAGPGIELFLAFLIASVVGFSTILTRTNALDMLFVQSFVVAALAGAILNLIPLPIQSGNTWIDNDGLGIIRSLRRSDADYRAEWEAQLREARNEEGRS